jgi:hypothetical protein
VAFDFSKLRGLIKEKFGSDKNFAEAMHMSTSALSGRLSGTVPWRTEEIPPACELLGITGAEISVYFFTPKVR